MANIYDQHTASFNRVSAYVVLRENEKVATVAIKFPKDGAGRLYVYVHWLGLRMVRGVAPGYGYDKASAACANAAAKLPLTLEDSDAFNPDDYRRFREFLLRNDGWDWSRNLSLAGFVVLQAV